MVGERAKAALPATGGGAPFRRLDERGWAQRRPEKEEWSDSSSSLNAKP